MKRDDLEKTLKEIEISIAKMEVHLNDIKRDVAETKLKQDDLSKRTEALEVFKAKTLGACSILIPLIAFISALGHDIIKRFMGW